MMNKYAINNRNTSKTQTTNRKKFRGIHSVSFRNASEAQHYMINNLPVTDGYNIQMKEQINALLFAKHFLYFGSRIES